VNTEAVEGTGADKGQRTRRWFRGQLRNIAPFITLLVLVAFFSLATPSFATLGNLNNILTQISITGIMATGLTFVILCAEIDLSVASVANATGIIVAFFTLQDASVAMPCRRSSQRSAANRWGRCPGWSSWPHSCWASAMSC
jgi:ribose transport system permease protein